MDDTGEKREAVASEARRLRDLWGQFARTRVPVAANCSCCAPGSAMFIDGAEFEQDILEFLHETFISTRNQEAYALLVSGGGFKPGEAGDLSAFLDAIAGEVEQGTRLGVWIPVIGDLGRTIESLTAFNA